MRCNSLWWGHRNIFTCKLFVIQMNDVVKTEIQLIGSRVHWFRLLDASCYLSSEWMHAIDAAAFFLRSCQKNYLKIMCITRNGSEISHQELNGITQYGNWISKTQHWTECIMHHSNQHWESTATLRRYVWIIGVFFLYVIAHSTNADIKANW